MSKGRAKLAISEGVSVWVLEAPEGFGDAGFHAHHAIQLTVCLSGTLELATADQSLNAAAIAVASDARHRFRASGLLAFIFVEPESRLGRGLAQALFGAGPLAELALAPIAAHLEPLRATFDEGLDDRALLAAGRAAAAAITPVAPAPAPDARVRRVIDYAAAHLDGPLSLASAAESVCLSPSRMRHLFVEQTGLAFKTYVLWLRLLRAVQVYSQGQSLTEAAHAAGFSDSAHFSRVFRRTFGLPATTLTRL